MFIHLHLHSPFSFLDGASDIETLVRAAAGQGMPALALTDHDSLAATVKFVTACRAYGVHPILGAEVTLEDESHLTLLARNRAGHANLCRLLTLGHLQGGRLSPHLPWEALPVYAEDLFCLSGCRKGSIPSLIRRHRYDEAKARALQLRDWFGSERLFLELQDDWTPDSRRVNRDLVFLARRIGVGVAATNNVHYAAKEDYVAHDVLRCIATGTTAADIHLGRPLNAERYLKTTTEMSALFDWCPEAITNTLKIAEQCEDVLPEAHGITPPYPTPAGQEGAAYLRHLAYKGAKARYRTITPPITARLDHELAVITELGYVEYFLMIWSIVREVRQMGIRCTGRGSAADSCVAYTLMLTDVDVIRRRLPFARFLAPGKQPDIDIDFPSDKRDDVFRHIVAKYGQENVGMCCTFSTFRAKSAVRDVGKALALPAETLQFFSHHFSHFVHADKMEEAFDRYAELKPYAALKERFQLLFALCARIAGFPRHIGTHSSGAVISRVPLDAIAPLQPSAKGLLPIWTLDKDDAEEIGALKFDVLALRALSAVSDAEQEIAHSDPRFRYDRIPNDDEETYRMMRAGAAVGTFQFESAAQMALAVTLHPEHFEDLVASVALIRPGPIRGNVVHRFVACRNGWARTDLVHPCLAPILVKTYGCIVFQEQVNDVVAAMTGCSDAEADRFRKRLTRHARAETMGEARETFVQQSLSRHPELHPDRVNFLFDQIEGWSGYGFTEGHAASFALTGYRTAYLSVHHPAEHFAGMMNHQPMGFFDSNTLAGEARRRGVRILPVEINRSDDKCRTEEPDTIRLGLRLVAGLRAEDIAAIAAARAAGEFRSLLDLCVRALLRRDALENLVLCGAFDNLHEHRRGLLWRLDETIGLAQAYRAGVGDDKQTSLGFGSPTSMATPLAWDIAEFSAWEQFLWTWRITGVCAEAHVFAHLRDALDLWNVMTVYHAQQQQEGARVTVAGLNTRPHRPPTRSGKTVLFTLLEDETGLLQTTCTGEAWEASAGTFLTAPVILVRGIIRRNGTGVSLLVEKAKPLRMEKLRANAETSVSRDRNENTPLSISDSGVAAGVTSTDVERSHQKEFAILPIPQ